MFSANFSFKPAHALLVGLSLVTMFSSSVQSQPVPAQIPLLNLTGGGVKPNLMLTMDDSGSMHFQHIPENQFAGGTFATTNPVGSRTVRWDPRDDYRVGVNFAGTVAGDINTTNYILRALRSTDTNSIFYNPETRYRPWMTNDGVTRLPNSPVNAAYKDPLIRTGAAGTVIDLRSYTAPAGSSDWCSNTSFSPAIGATVNAGSFVIGMDYAIITRGSVPRTNFTNIGASDNEENRVFTATGVGSGNGSARLVSLCPPVANNSASLNHDPGVYFRLQKQNVNAGSFVTGTAYTISTVGTTNFTLIGATSNTVGLSFTATGAGSGTGVAQGYKAVNNSANYTGYSINVGANFPKVAARTDCAGAVGATGCSQTEERQNFANWFTYYRSRNLLARGAMMEAFATVVDTLRVGFGRINKGSATVDGITNTKVVESNTTLYGGGGVRDFTQARKNQLYKWLEDLPANGGTPLPSAMDAVGQYYSRTDGAGPYTDTPGGTNTVANNKTCRRSYHLMVTDGYWNEDNPPVVGDLDSTAGSQISGGTFAFAANTRPYTDGFSNTLADVAMKYWKNDLQPDIANKVVANSVDPSYWQSMTNFTVGLGVRGALDSTVDLPALVSGTKSWSQPSKANISLPANIDDLWHAAVNSRGAYYSAKDPGSLASAITGALAGSQGGSGATAGVATVSSVLQNGNRKYVPTYNGTVWSGDISAQPLDANGQATAAVWSAAARLPAWGSRSIFTWDTAPLASPSTPGAVAFTWASLSTANQARMTSGSSNLVDFLRGDHSNEVSLTQPTNLFRERKDSAGTAFVLGDFVNSNPVLIKGLFDGGYGGLNLGGANGYQIFTAAKAARDAVLFVGGNDGMLHGFKDVNALPPLPSTAATDGQEVFAYVPRTVYPDLSKLSDKTYGATVPHKFYVDGPQREFDAFVAGPAYPAFSGHPACAAGATCWRNYLVGSLGAGARAVYALDVTSSPNLGASNIRWELNSETDADLGYVLAPIEVGVLPSGKWVAIFGNGFSSTNQYATLFVVDLETAAITKLNVDTTGNNGLGGVGVVRDSFGHIINLYAGDLKGKLWKFDYNTPSVPFVVSGGSTALFTATSPSTGSPVQAITQPPSIFDHSQGGKLVVFGTGKLLTSTDQTNTEAQTIYGVWDKPADSVPRPMSRSSLVSRTLTSQNGTGSAASTVFYSLAGTAVNWATQRGWYIDLSPPITGGRVIYPTQIISSKLALVTAVAPPQSAAVCDASTGIGVDFVFDVESGRPSTAPLFDTNGDGVVNSSDASVVGVQTSSVGIRALVRGVGGGTICDAGFKPVSIQNATGQSMVCVPDIVPPPVVPGAITRNFQRIQKRIINPPIR